jgi:hypothetical protein
LASCNFCKQEYRLDFKNGGKKMQLDRVTPHLCEGQQQQKTPTELALMKVASFDRIADALEKNNNNDAI